MYINDNKITIHTMIAIIRTTIKITMILHSYSRKLFEVFFSSRIVRNLLSSTLHLIFLTYLTSYLPCLFKYSCGKSNVMTFWGKRSRKMRFSLQFLIYCYAKFMAFQENWLQLLWKKGSKFFFCDRYKVSSKHYLSGLPTGNEQFYRTPG